MPSSVADVTHALLRVADGSESGDESLVPLLYDRFKALARNYLRGESPGHSLQPTELVHEAYLKLVDQNNVDWKSRSHFFAVGAMAMRRILVDHAKKKKRRKRGGGAERITLVESKVISPHSNQDVLAIDEALTALAALNEHHARIVEMRFFGGLSVEEVAAVMGISDRTVRREWVACRAWLRKRLGN